MPPSRPVLIELDDPAPSPADAAPVPDVMGAGAMPVVAAMATGGSLMGRLSFWVLTTFAGFVVSGMDAPTLRFYAMHNPYAYRGCSLPAADLAGADQFTVDADGQGEEQLGLSPTDVWQKMAI